MEKKGLGRGLNALIPGAKQEAPMQAGVEVKREIDIDKISLNPYQPRKTFNPEKSAELIDSVRTHGILQPILVRSKNDGSYELVAGERRLRAAKAAGLNKIPAEIRDLTEKQSLEFAIIENVQREDINVIEAARAYRQLMTDFNLSQEMIATQIGKSRSAIANTLRLLSLPDEIMEYIANGALTEGHGRALLRIENKDRQLTAAKHIMQFKLSVRESERLVKNILDPKPESEIRITRKDPNLADMETSLRNIFGTKVSIINNKSRGKIEIEFYNDDDMERILQLLLEK